MSEQLSWAPQTPDTHSVQKTNVVEGEAPESRDDSDDSMKYEFFLAQGEGKDMEGVTLEEFLKMPPEEQTKILGNYRG